MVRKRKKEKGVSETTGGDKQTVDELECNQEEKECSGEVLWEVKVNNRFIAGESLESDGDDDENGGGIDVEAEKRRIKKNRQKAKKLARKMAGERRASEVSLVELSSGVSVVTAAEAVTPADPADSISLFKCPFKTLKYSGKEIIWKVLDVKNRYLASRRDNNGCARAWEALVISSIFGGILFGAYSWITFSDPVSVKIKTYILWYLYWIFLGIMSSVGLGSGLHTFILYLGPFIAKVSLAAQECSSLDFPMPPYPHQITCPSKSGGDEVIPSIMEISSKVRFETLAWGFGTALGELPPYFIARAASLTNGTSTNPDDLDSQTGCFARVQRVMRDFVMKIGFWGILVCASIPNPLFDLAGITCGHFQVPFAIFFGATAIGKTVIKSQLQMLVVILAFNEKSLHSILQSIGKIPWAGQSLHKLITDFMDYQRAVLRNDGTSQSAGILKAVIEAFVCLVIVYFVGSIITSLAKSYSQRIPPEEQPPKRLSKRRKSNKRLSLDVSS